MISGIAPGDWHYTIEDERRIVRIYYCGSLMFQTDPSAAIEDIQGLKLLLDKIEKALVLL